MVVNCCKHMKKRHIILSVLIVLVVLAQILSPLGYCYSAIFYPVISWILSGVSSLIPFSIGDIFITVSIAGLILLPIYYRYKNKTKWKVLLLHDGEYLLWVYVWFYLAWGLNYSQPHFLQRMQISPAQYTQTTFNRFINKYVGELNSTYLLWQKQGGGKNATKVDVGKEIPLIYRQIGDSLKIHLPQHSYLRPKTMLFSTFIASVGVSGYMGPFYGEFHLNGYLLPVDYPSVYAHEMAHLLGISSEAEANFYAYQVCTRSKDASVRFSGYFFVLGYVLRNARMVMTDAQFDRLKKSIDPAIKRLYNYHHYYWTALYSPTLGDIQDKLYELYLKGNKIENGQKNYSQVIGLLISYERYKKQI